MRSVSGPLQAAVKPCFSHSPSNEVKQGKRKKTCGRRSKRKQQIHNTAQQRKLCSQHTNYLFQGQKQTNSFPCYFLNCNIAYFLPYICNNAKHLEIKLSSRTEKKEMQLCYHMVKGTVFILKLIQK